MRAETQRHVSRRENTTFDLNTGLDQCLITAQQWRASVGFVPGALDKLTRRLDAHAKTSEA
jgi:hypothetical protein